jgi:GNAT superfamily N-acetyltransferase
MDRLAVPNVIEIRAHDPFAEAAESLRLSVPEFTRPVEWSPLHYVYGAMIGERLVGMANVRINPDPNLGAANIRYMAVAEGIRGEGIGGILLEHVAGAMKSKGFYVLALEATNDTNERFYKNHGFARKGNVEGWRYMERKLNPAWYE